MPATLRSSSDAVAVEAVDLAREALLVDVPADDVGEHLGHRVDAQRVVTHLFACRRRGYVGWHWAVTLTRASRQKKVTVDEVVLLPGEQAVVAPAWVPYRDRIRPGDLSPGDLLPVSDDDPRLVPTWSFGDQPSVDPLSEGPGPLDDAGRAQVKAVARELGLGRVRTLSVEGRDAAAQRWHDGEAGPGSAVAQAAPDSCWSCGFLVRLAGPLSESFGVCANGDANDDGRVVALDHGCGAHSEVRLAKKHEPQPLPPHVVDTLSLDDLDLF